ncbi:ATP-binding protein, partial [Thermodesulfobacteriota bacterium]
ALDKMTTCVDKITKQNQLEQEIGDLEKDVDSYKQTLSEALGKINRQIQDDKRIAILVEDLFAEWEESKRNQTEKSGIEKQLRNLESKSGSVREPVDFLQKQIQSLLEEAGAKDEDEFRRKERLFSERERLADDIARAKKSIRQIAGESDLDNLKEFLQGQSLDEIRAREKELSLQSADLEGDLESLRNQRAALNQAIETMKSSEDVVRLRAQEEHKLAEIQQDAFDWSRYAMAKYLLDKAKETFEKEQQPQVMRDAGSFFRKITASSYNELVAPIGEDTIEVITSKKERKKVDMLSRGTAEQLYLSLRFGYIRNRSKGNEPLPVVMDDILVNFDPGRARRAAEAILDLSKEQQVLFFTCHPETVEIFRQVDSRVPLCVLENGHILRQ